jgi:hypothetical protein
MDRMELEKTSKQYKADLTHRHLDNAAAALRHVLFEGGKVEIDDDAIEEMAQGQHEAWMIEKEAQGYVWGPHTDDLLKINELLVPWNIGGGKLYGMAKIIK